MYFYLFNHIKLCTKVDMNINEERFRIFQEGKMHSKKCIFCDPIPERCLFETKYFRVLIDTYPITAGHLMISSKEHYGMAGELPDTFQQEYVDLKHEMHELMLKMGSSVCFYEHGKAGSCHSISSDAVHCEHFHLHCLPIAVCIHQAIEQSFQSIPLQSYDQLFHLSQAYGSYLYFENSFGEKKMYPAEDSQVPSHFLRTLICTALNTASLATWQSYSDFQRYLASLQLIQKTVWENKQHALS